jgi:sigma-B regulation protein RsbU (phosphoserine phosphatase)
MPLLRVEQKHEKPFEVDMNKEAFTIGRSSANDLTFNNLSLSRHHARIIRKEEKFFVEDTGSRNGTFLNGIRIRQASPLKNEDVIQLGEITIRYLSPISERVEVRDTAPALGMEATFMIDTDELNIRRYAEEAISGITPVGAGENLWPALQQAAATLITHYPIEKLVEVIMDIVFEAVPAERGALIMLDPKNTRELELKVVRNAHGDQNLQISRTIIDEVMRNQKAVLTLDAQTDERFGSAQSIQMQGIRSIICVPLWNEKNVIGLIYIDNLISRRTFTQSDLRLIALIANMAAVKIENSLLLEEQLEKKMMEEQLAVAAQIQRRLLPQINPENANYQIYGINHSCYQIGGDYYDFIDKGNGKLAIVIADVSGKGVGAALLMAAFQASIRTLLKSEGGLAALMAQLNNVMFENSPPNKYITVFYGELDTIHHTFEFVNAGHNPAIYLKEDGHQLLEGSGPVVGIIANAQYKSQQIQLGVNELLFLYTDGITEAVDPQEQEFGEEGVLKVLTGNRRAGVEDLAHILERQISEFTRGAPPLDDSTLIFVRRVQ